MSDEMSKGPSSGTLFAAYLPARGAATVDPMVAFGYE